MSELLSKNTGAAPGTGRRGKRWGFLAGLAILAGLAAMGCSQGSYPLDIFYEMHYQQSYKANEPPSLSAPESSVPWFPGPVSTSFNTGEHLFAVNCAMCHGAAGKGDGPVLRSLMETYKYVPIVDPDLTSPQARAVGLGGIEGFMVSGVSVMPSFAKLLSVDERTAIARYVVDTLQQAPAAPAVGEQPPAPAATPAPAAGAVRISAKGDALEFDRNRIEVAAGSGVALVFENVSSINQHNWVVVRRGTKDAVAQRGTSAGPGNAWVQPGDADVIAATALLGPGETGEVRFAAPPAGTYQFVCTFPGHNFTMFGDLVVTP